MQNKLQILMDDLWEEAVKNSTWKTQRRFLYETEWWNKWSVERSKRTFTKNGNFVNKMDKEEFDRLKQFVTKDSIVLEIGAGCGRLAIPFARNVKKVIAVEPSPLGIKIMKRFATKWNISNIEFINETWKNAQIKEKCDLVIAAYLEGSLDPDFLMKMHNTSKRFCCVEMMAGELDYHFYRELYPFVTGKKFNRGIDYIYIVNSLYGRGIYANVEIYKSKEIKRFSSLKEALKEWIYRFSYFTEINQNLKEKLIEYYKMKSKKDGTFFDTYERRRALVWWEV